MTNKRFNDLFSLHSQEQQLRVSVLRRRIKDKDAEEIATADITRSESPTDAKVDGTVKRKAVITTMNHVNVRIPQLPRVENPGSQS